MERTCTCNSYTFPDLLKCISVVCIFTQLLPQIELYRLQVREPVVLFTTAFEIFFACSILEQSEIEFVNLFLQYFFQLYFFSKRFCTFFFCSTLRRLVLHFRRLLKVQTTDVTCSSTCLPLFYLSLFVTLSCSW